MFTFVCVRSSLVALSHLIQFPCASFGCNILAWVSDFLYSHTESYFLIFWGELFQDSAETLPIKKRVTSIIMFNSVLPTDVTGCAFLLDLLIIEYIQYISLRSLVYIIFALACHFYYNSNWSIGVCNGEPLKERAVADEGCMIGMLYTELDVIQTLPTLGLVGSADMSAE